MKSWTQLATYDVPYKDEQYSVEVEGTFYESMENQDADGNRGMLITSCDDIKILSISPLPPSKEALHYIEEHIYSLNTNDFNWLEYSNDDEEAPWDEDDDIEVKA